MNCSGKHASRVLPRFISSNVNLSGMDVSSISLRETLGRVSFVGAGDVTASRFCCDSRKVFPGDVFVAVSGPNLDGHRFVDTAVAAGAAAVIVERPNPRINVPQCVVADSRAAFAHVCMAQYGQPEKSLTVAGITGTNGKTTSTWLLRSILETASKQTGLLGTIEYSNGRVKSDATLTTPEPTQVAMYFSQMVAEQTSHCVMEISSHALDQRRCAAVPLSVAAITNITQDHFDYHGDSQRYRTAKSLIANLLLPGAPLLVGIDDLGCRIVLDQLPSATRTLTFGFDSTAQVRAEVIARSAHHQVIRLALLTGTVELQTDLVGNHNVLNLLTAAAMAEQMGVDGDVIRSGLERVSHVPGRMERINIGQPFCVLVDYAHTPDGIAHCLATAKSLTQGRVVLVFGAGGNRDAEKRPLMARAAEGANVVIVTSDNPRAEVPQRIIDEICTGFTSMDHVRTCVDRQQAIRMAFESAVAGDVVVIAGRGHESIQQIGDRRISFDDRKVAQRILREMALSGPFSSPQIPTAIPA